MLLCTTAWAGTVTFVAGTDKGATTDQSADQITKNGITIASTSAGLAYADYRFYNGTITISSTVGTITQVEFTCTSDNYASVLFGSTPSTGSFSADGTKITWNGSATSFTIRNTAQTRASQIVVTYTESQTSVAMPTIAFNPATAYEGETVTCEITASEGVEIHYTTDGTTPDGQSALYSASFTLSATTTIKAVAVDGEMMSDVAENTITFNPTVSTLAALNDLYTTNGTAVAFNGEAIITYVSGNNCYVKDASGVALLFGYNVFGDAQVGKKITGFKGAAKLYNSLPEVADIADVTYADDDPVTVSPTERTITEINENPVLNEYTVLRSVSITTPNNKNFTITDAENNTLQGRDNFSLQDFPSPVADKIFDIKGFVAKYNTSIQFYPTFFEDVTPVAAVAEPVIAFDKENPVEGEMVNCTITCATEGAIIQYALGEGNYQEYTAAIQLTETTIVKAKAVLGENESNVATATITFVAAPHVMGKCQLVTSATDLVADKYYLIVSTVDNDTYALSTTQNSNNRGASAETIAADGTITPSENAQVIKLEGSAEGWYFNVGNAYLCAVKGSNNYLRTKEEKDDYSKAVITIGEEGSTSIEFQGSDSRNVLQFNPNTNNNNPLFSCYASASQKPVVLYKEVEAGTTYTITPDKAPGAYDGMVLVKPVVDPALPEGAKIYYTFTEGTAKAEGETEVPATGVKLTKSGTLTFIARAADNTELAHSENLVYTINSLFGDLNGDGEVDVADVNILVNIILGTYHPNN